MLNPCRFTVGFAGVGGVASLLLEGLNAPEVCFFSALGGRASGVAVTTRTEDESAAGLAAGGLGAANLDKSLETLV